MAPTHFEFGAPRDFEYYAIRVMTALNGIGAVIGFWVASPWFPWK